MFHPHPWMRTSTQDGYDSIQVTVYLKYQDLNRGFQCVVRRWLACVFPREWLIPRMWFPHAPGRRITGTRLN